MTDAPVRRAKLADIDEVAALYAARDRALRGEVRSSRDELAAHWPAGGGWIVPDAGFAAVDRDGELRLCVVPSAQAAATAATLIAAAASGRRERLEAVVDAADAAAVTALERAGFAREHEVIEMTRELEATESPSAAPAGVTLRTFDNDRDARAVHACLVAAFAGSHESVMPFERWHPWLTSDPAYDPEVVIVADAGGAVAGVAQCWVDGWVKDLAVMPDARGRGLGEALLREAFARLAARGVRRCGLKVDADNPTGAPRLYARVGMVELRRHAVYARGAAGAAAYS